MATRSRDNIRPIRPAEGLPPATVFPTSRIRTEQSKLSHPNNAILFPKDTSYTEGGNEANPISNIHATRRNLLIDQIKPLLSLLDQMGLFLEPIPVAKKKYGDPAILKTAEVKYDTESYQATLVHCTHESTPSHAFFFLVNHRGENEATLKPALLIEISNDNKNTYHMFRLVYAKDGSTTMIRNKKAVFEWKGSERGFYRLLKGMEGFQITTRGDYNRHSLGTHDKLNAPPETYPFSEKNDVLEVVSELEMATILSSFQRFFPDIIAHVPILAPGSAPAP
jgi:hypothetical protein